MPAPSSEGAFLLPPSDEGGVKTVGFDGGREIDYPSVSLLADSSPDKGSQGGKATNARRLNIWFGVLDEPQNILLFFYLPLGIEDK